MTGSLYIRSGEDLWTHKNVFTSPTLEDVDILNTAIYRTFRHTQRLVFPAVPKGSATNMARLTFIGTHIAALADVFKLPQRLNQLRPGGRGHGQPVSSPLPKHHSGIWNKKHGQRHYQSCAKLSPLRGTLKTLEFYHSGLPAYEWSSFRNLTSLHVSAWNLFPTGPRRCKTFSLFQLIPKTLQKLEVDCNLSLELDGLIDTGHPEKNNVIHYRPTFERLVKQLQTAKDRKLAALKVRLTHGDDCWGVKFEGPPEEEVQEGGVQEEGVQEEGVQEEGVQEEGVQEEGVQEEGVQEEGVREQMSTGVKANELVLALLSPLTLMTPAFEVQVYYRPLHVEYLKI
ncbi:hypothetical protein V8F33_000082 [Rhypophila sp. PSN 637]